MRAESKNTQMEMSAKEREAIEKMPMTSLVYIDDFDKLQLVMEGVNSQLDQMGKTPGEKKQIIASMVNEISVRGLTPLHWPPLKENSYRIAKFLIDNGADVNAVDEIGETAFHGKARAVARMYQEFKVELAPEEAVKVINIMFEGTLPILDLYIAAGANYNALDYHKKSPMQYLCEAIPQTELDAQFVKPNLSLPHLQKAVDEYFASARKSRDPSGHSTDSSDRHSSENEDPISSSVIPVKTGIQHSGRNSKTHAAKTTANDEKNTAA